MPVQSRIHHTDLLDLAGDMMDRHFQKSVRSHACCHGYCSLGKACLVDKQAVLRLHKVAGLDPVALVGGTCKEGDNRDSRNPHRHRSSLVVHLKIWMSIGLNTTI